MNVSFDGGGGNLVAADEKFDSIFYSRSRYHFGSLALCDRVDTMTSISVRTEWGDYSANAVFAFCSVLFYLDRTVLSSILSTSSLKESQIRCWLDY